VAGEGADRREGVHAQAQIRGQAQPAAGELVRLARARLAAELDALPPWESPLLWARLRLTAGPQVVTLGALVHHLRAAVRRGDAARTRELFALLLWRIERENARWAAHVVERTPALRGAEADAARDDLMQELALRVWLEAGQGAGESWELFFSRALAYARQHTAAGYMQQRGLWTRAGVRLPTRMLPHLLSRLALTDADGEGDGGEGPGGVRVADERDHFSAAELADLRAHVRALPEREQVAVVMRYWQQAPEAEIAAALGVSTRMVRTYLQRAHHLLRAAYGGTEDGL